MALLDWMAPESTLRVDGEQVRLRQPRARDYPQWAALRSRSRSFLQPWEPTWPADDLTKTAFRRRLAAYSREIDLGTAYPFFVFRTEDDALVGGVTLSNVRRGVAQMGTIGYWAGQPYSRQGYTLAAVKQLSRFAFGALALHRLEAACVPENERSAGLLIKAGFKAEGRAAAYLKINGEWRDHLLFGLIAATPGRPANS
jgi:ribosomal-protein-alanine N-acetyltransferase